MRFFTRCKILYRSLMLFCVCMGIFLALRLSSISVDSPLNSFSSVLDAVFSYF